MLAYLRQWLSKRAGEAPVWVTLTDEDRGTEYIMLAVDETGIVLALPSAPGSGAAMPWSAVASVMPKEF